MFKTELTSFRESVSGAYGSSYVGNGIINVDGPLWRLQRKAALPFFNTSNLRDLLEDALPSYVADMKADLREAAHVGKLIDLEHIFLELTTRFMGNLAYNMDIDASAPFSSAFDFASGAVGERFQNPLWKVTEVLFGGRLRAALAEVKSFGRKIVETAMHNRKERSQKETSEKSGYTASRGKLIDSLMDALDDPTAVADAALNFLSAGRDTTAQALTWTFYLLMRNPRVVELIRSELSALHANDQFKPKESPCLTFDQLQPSQLPYISAVFNESLRLYPPVPIEIKQCERATTLPDGTFLPQGAVIVWCTWAINRSRSLWGEDALSFRPERWLEEIPDRDLSQDQPAMRLMSKTAFEFPVFNGGSRTCMGRRLAELQASYIIASLVWEFEFEEGTNERGPHERPERISRNSLTLPMEGGLPTRVTIGNE
ncbi:MAG: hypothetical protein M4579_003197 [Chaenotheca gracillima]|nr:MAG: hypothetical protein M4579_003197 [Chaenotheca gracillima]